MEKLEWRGYQMVKKKFEDMFSHFDRIRECEWLTDGQTDILRWQSVLCIRVVQLSTNRKAYMGSQHLRLLIFYDGICMLWKCLVRPSGFPGVSHVLCIVSKWLQFKSITQSHGLSATAELLVLKMW